MKQLIEYSLEKEILSLNKQDQIQYNSFPRLKVSEKKDSLNSTNSSKISSNIFLRRTINIRALFHHFRIIWNYSKKGKTATLLPWLHTIPCSSPYFSPLFFTATTEGGEKLSTPADSHPFFPSRLFARHFLSLPAGKFSFTSARIRESSTRPRATREAKSKKRKGREGRRSGTVIERERERKSIARLIFTLKRISCL